MEGRKLDKRAREIDRSLVSKSCSVFRYFLSFPFFVKNFHNSLFPGSWTRYSGFSVILDEKLCSRANGFENLLLQTAVCMLLRSLLLNAS